MAAGSEFADFLEHGLRQNAAHLDCTGAAFFERSVIEKGVWIRIQDFVRELRRHGCVHGNALNAAIGHRAQKMLESFEVHRLVEDVLHDFSDQRMVRNLDVAFDIFLAGGDIRKDRGQQIVGTNALNLWRNFLAALEAQQR